MTKHLIIDAIIGIIVCIVGIIIISGSSPETVASFSANISEFISRVLGK